MTAKTISRPSGTAIFFVALFGVVLATSVLFLVPAPGRGGEENAPAQQLGPESRPTSQPTSRPTSQPTSRPASQPTSPPVEMFPHDKYAALLGAYLKNGRVDYAGLASKGRNDLNEIVGAIASTNGGTLDALSRAERTAWYINAYNVLTLKTIVDHYPLASIMDIDKAWDTPMNVAGRQMTLNQIEHDILRLKDAPDKVRRDAVDPRIHFALNCASIGCPDLLEEPFTEQSLDTLLERGTRNFVADSSKFRIENGVLHISQLLNWYGEDFTLPYEADITPKQAIGRFFAEYINSPPERALLRGGEFEIEWIEYDWRLNDQSTQ